MEADTTSRGRVPEWDYLRMQGEVGISKHLGGSAATRELLGLCHADRAAEVLDVGCGTGAGPVLVATTYPCRVTGADRSMAMLRWAQRRIREVAVAGRVGLCAADVLALPFPADHFDVVICESVLDFVPDKEAALRECIRVTRPGGWVGINEALWLRQPSPGWTERTRLALGATVPDQEAWRRLWAGSGLEERVVHVRSAHAVREMVQRVSWIGWPWLLRAWGRALHVCLTDPAARRSLRRQFQVPPSVLCHMGYGLMAGRKPGAGPAPIPSAMVPLRAGTGRCPTAGSGSESPERPPTIS